LGYPIGKYSCSKCTFTQGAGISAGRRSYLLDDGAMITMRCMQAWCDDCACLTQAEDVALAGPLDDLRRAASSLASVTAQRRWWKTVWFWKSFEWFDAGLDSASEMTPSRLRDLGAMIERARQQVDYLTTRTERPHCLACGGQRLVHTGFQVTERGRGYLHPGCGGLLIHTIQGSLNLGRTREHHVHRPDGTYLHGEAYEEPWPEHLHALD